MDNELKTYLEQMEARIEAQMQGVENRMAALMASEIGSLHSDMQTIERRILDRLDALDSRLKLQAGLIQIGMRGMVRFSEFAEASESRWLDLVSRVEALEKKVSAA